ncbi:cupin domain-containing protein [Actinomadura rupiterrae]|uniref:cupin domain-containing protein n=1 Tax=Actinomadura rupiterrae TaxID=559627 RepID=UPI0020A26FE8|nr:cupin domain-containing protein [Actinomadura rupiterrae]MCP2341086.1 putative monooxygenase [Actinomadura rupiterrae]
MADGVAERTARTFARCDCAVNARRGGEIRVLLSPKTVGSTSGFMGDLVLKPGEYVSEHYHPYSEEYLYVLRGSLHVRLEGDEELTVGAEEGVLIPIGVRHRVSNAGDEEAFAVFHLAPLAPRPELGHVDTEEPPGAGAANPEVGGPR